MRQAHQVGARIGHRRHARFRDQSGIAPGQQGFQQAGQRLRRGIHVQFGNLDFLQGLGQGVAQRNQFQEAACGLGVFGDKVIKTRGQGLDLLGDDVGERMVGRVGRAEGVGDQI